MKFYSPALLFTAATLIICTTEGSYESLSTLEQELVDMAITKANNQYKKSRQHINYVSTNGVPRLEPHFTKFNVFLKPTNCIKGDGSSGFTHRQGCNLLHAKCFSTNIQAGQQRHQAIMTEAVEGKIDYLQQPCINCIVCKNRPGSDYFIDCIRHDYLSKVHYQGDRDSHCFERYPGTFGSAGIIESIPDSKEELARTSLDEIVF